MRQTIGQGQAEISGRIGLEGQAATALPEEFKVPLHFFVITVRECKGLVPGQPPPELISLITQLDQAQRPVSWVRLIVRQLIRHDLDCIGSAKLHRELLIFPDCAKQVRVLALLPNHELQVPVADPRRAPSWPGYVGAAADGPVSGCPDSDQYFGMQGATPIAP